MVRRRIALIAFLLCFCINLIPYGAQATAPTDTKECSLTISYCCDKSAFSKLPVKLYKIADVSAEEQYTLTSPFESLGLILNGIKNADEWNDIRSTLESYILANDINADFTVTTNQDGKAQFEMLKKGLYLAITERVTRDDTTYVFASSLVALPGIGADGLLQYQVTVAAKSQIIPPNETDEKKEFKVVKLWKGDKKSNRPKSIKVEIFCDGKSYKTVTLSKDNNWTYSWSTKDTGADWKVIERNVPKKYKMTIKERKSSFVITNTLIRKEPDKLSGTKTGDTSNIMLYIILMIVSGSILIVLGFTGKRNRV